MSSKLRQFEKYVCNVFALPDLLANLTDQRRDPQISTFDVVNSLFHTAVLRIPSINALEGDLKESDFQKLIGRHPTPDVLRQRVRRLLFVFVILSHDRRRPIHLAVTANPTAEWTTRQLLEVFPWDSAPRYLFRGRDACYGKEFHEATGWLGIREVLMAPRSPWQNLFVERLIGTIRRECLDHVIILNETGLRRVLKSYFEYYERMRTHLSLDKDAPIPRRVQPPEWDNYPEEEMSSATIIEGTC